MKKLEEFESYTTNISKVIGGVRQIMGGDLTPDGNGGLDSYRDLYDVLTGETQCHVSMGKDSADWDPMMGLSQRSFGGV